MTAATKSLVEKFDEEGVPTGKLLRCFKVKIMPCLVGIAGIILEISEEEILMWEMLKLSLNFARKNKLRIPIFYAIQCDDEDRMINFFWVDGRARLSYQFFGDVVTFDTTYKTNKYDMPFAPFTGLNHHFQSILFGCALLQDETQKSFEWLFTFILETMFMLLK